MSHTTQQSSGDERKQSKDDSNRSVLHRDKDGVEKVPAGSHEDFNENAESGAGAQVGKKDHNQGRKEYTGATEAGEEDLGAKMNPEKR